MSEITKYIDKIYNWSVTIAGSCNAIIASHSYSLKFSYANRSDPVLNPSHGDYIT